MNIKTPWADEVILMGTLTSSLLVCILLIYLTLTSPTQCDQSKYKVDQVVQTSKYQNPLKITDIIFCGDVVVYETTTIFGQKLPINEEEIVKEVNQ